MRPVTKTQGNLVISSLNSDCECWFPLFFYGSARRRRAELSQEMWRHLQFVWMCFDISWSLIFRVTFSESFLWHKLKHNFRQRGSRLATLSLAQGLVQAHERPPKFCSCTHQAPHAGSCERSVPPPRQGTCRGRAGHAGQGLKPRTSARQRASQKALLSPAWGATPWPRWSASWRCWCSGPGGGSWHTSLQKQQKSTTWKGPMWGRPGKWIFCTKHVTYRG